MALSRAVGPTIQGKVSKGEPAGPHPGPVFKGLDLLVGWLTETSWDDGTSREPGSLLVFAQDHRWKAMITDKDGGNIAFVTAEDFLGLLRALEKGLRENSLDWRESRSGTPRKKA